MISGNMVGSYSQMGKTFILVDEDGNEITGVCVDNPVVFTAGDNDVRDGFIYAGDEGVSTGSKEILEYRTTEGKYLILSGKSFSIPLSQHNKYNYTKLQCIISKYDSDPANRMSADRIVIEDNVYAVNSSQILSNVTKNADSKSIDLNITNNTSDIYLIYYFTYKEET